MEKQKQNRNTQGKKEQFAGGRVGMGVSYQIWKDNKDCDSGTWVDRPMEQNDSLEIYQIHTNLTYDKGSITNGWG